MLVTFVLLDKAPFPGDVTNFPKETSLDQAYQVLTDSVNQGNLQILVSAPGFNNVSSAQESYKLLPVFLHHLGIVGSGLSIIEQLQFSQSKRHI